LAGSCYSANGGVAAFTLPPRIFASRIRSHIGRRRFARKDLHSLDPNSCLDPQFVVDAFVNPRPINGRDERCFSSRLAGGAHFAMADGAVKFINEECSTTILRRLANRADGEPIADKDIETVK
jgi:uncharacterized protein DUF1559